MLQIGPLKYNMDDGFYFDFEVPFMTQTSW